VTPVRRYALYQLPGVVFVAVAAAIAWWAHAISATIAGGLVALWIAKDVALYPVVRRSYRDARAPSERLIGTRAEVRVRLDPRGWVSARGELWRAEVRGAGAPLDAGRVVVVRGVDGLVLVVEAAD
jgi:membrane protein implicated in regulation of membrane protease activity